MCIYMCVRYPGTGYECACTSGYSNSDPNDIMSPCVETDGCIGRSNNPYNSNNPYDNPLTTI